jgi:hypothetical protein
MIDPCSQLCAFLASQRVGVLAVQMLDGTPHGATVHFAHTEDPLVFTFETDRRYRKFEPLAAGAAVPATFVTGFEEGESRTAQFDGVAQVIDAGDPLIERYLEKFPEKRTKYQGKHVVWLTFTPRWWRYTDWTSPEGKTIYNSDGTVVRP